MFFGAALSALGADEFKSLGGDAEDSDVEVDMTVCQPGGAASGKLSGLGAGAAAEIDLQPAKGQRGKYKRDKQHMRNRASAFAEVQANRMTVPAAALAFGVAESTLRGDIRVGGVQFRRRPGRQPSNPVVEECLVKWMIVCANLGWPQTKGTIIAKATQLAKAKKSPFKGEQQMPCEKWWKASNLGTRTCFACGGPTRVDTRKLLLPPAPISTRSMRCWTPRSRSWRWTRRGSGTQTKPGWIVSAPAKAKWRSRPV